MKRNSFVEDAVMFLLVIGVFAIIGVISNSSESKCIEYGCNNRQASGSSYCSIHKPYDKNSSYGSSSYSSKTTSYPSDTSSKSTYNSYSGNSYTTDSSSYSTVTPNSTTQKSSSSKSYTYNSYDDGYDDIYMDGDYDYDRYDSDSDYADGVDDAMDEFGEDW